MKGGQQFIGTIGTSEGLGTSNTGYLNTYRIQINKVITAERSDGDLKYLLKQFWSLEAIGSHCRRSNHFPPKRN